MELITRLAFIFFIGIFFVLIVFVVSLWLYKRVEKEHDKQIKEDFRANKKQKETRKQAFLKQKHEHQQIEYHYEEE